MCSVLFYPIDYNTIFNLCKVCISLWLCFVKISSHLSNCNRCDDWHLYIPCSSQPHMHLAHLAKWTLTPVLSWLVLYICQIVNLYYKSIWSCTSWMLLHVLFFLYFVTSFHCKSIQSHTPCMLLYVLFFDLFDHTIILYYICKCICSCAFCTLLYVCMYVCYIVVMWTILSLMPTTSHPKAHGGVC